jgi:hypothetical protein
MFLLLFLAISCNQVDYFLKKKELISNILKNIWQLETQTILSLQLSPAVQQG